MNYFIIKHSLIFKLSGNNIIFIYYKLDIVKEHNNY
jgi:hypothetical protein